MISFYKALEYIDAERIGLSTEKLALNDAFGRTLAEPVYSQIQLPPFSTARMDGYAIASDENRTELEVLATIAAGSNQTAASPRPGACVRIMTGARIPQGTERVVPREYVKESGDHITLRSSPNETYISRAGSYLQAGTELKQSGRLTVAEIGAFSGAGVQKVTVYTPVQLTILITGDELCTADKPLQPGQIYDAIGPMLYNRAVSSGVEIANLQTIGDNPSELEQAIMRGVDHSHVILVSGGVSRGDYDYTAGVLDACGFQTLFHRVAIKPGRPLLFGKRRKEDGSSVYAFGLPGNPVSAFLDYVLFVERLIRISNSLPPAPAGYRVRTLKHVTPSDPLRGEFYPMNLKNGLVQPIEYGNSGNLMGFSAAKGVVYLPAGASEVTAGEEVYVRPLW